jgi:hypothetical protein
MTRYIHISWDISRDMTHKSWLFVHSFCGKKNKQVEVLGLSMMTGPKLIA